jgi:hypothetical protein
MAPDGLARADAIARDDFVLAALFLCVEQIAADRERRPPGTHLTPPHLHGRRRRPVGGDRHRMDDAVAIRSAKSRPFRRLVLDHRRRRSGWRRRGLTGWRGSRRSGGRRRCGRRRRSRCARRRRRLHVVGLREQPFLGRW